MDYRWDPAKDEWLRQTRSFGFADVVQAIRDNRLIADVPNPSISYLNQKMLIVEIDGYAIGVPYIAENGIRFLKTAFPSRKLKRQFMEI